MAAVPGSPTARIAVWSDYVCPFCYLELPVVERLRDEIGDAVAIDWRAFELRPEPAPTLDPGGDYLHRVWAASVSPMAAERGMVLKLPPVQPRSRHALEAAEFARLHGRFDAMHRVLFRAFFEDGRDIGDIAVLVDIGRSAGLDGDGLREALATGAHTGKVLADQTLAQRIGLSGVPALLIQIDGRGTLLTGAQPYETVRGAVAQALGEETFFPSHPRD